MIKKTSCSFTFLLVVVLFFGSTPLRAYEVQYQKSDSLKVIELLGKARELPRDENLIIFFAREFKDMPYVAHTLEVNNIEKLVVNLREFDCTTYVGTVLALYMCMWQRQYNFTSFCDNLKDIRYRDGNSPDYLERLHYFTDWIENNTSMGFCLEINSPDPPFSSTQAIKVNYMSTYPEKYSALKSHKEYIPKIKEMEKAINGKTYKFIPKSKVNETSLLKEVIRDGDIIATTTSLSGLDIQHLGFAIWHKDGLHMLNASSLHHKVVEEKMTLYEYLQKQKTMTGIRIIRPRE